MGKAIQSKQRLGTGTESQEICTNTHKKREKERERASKEKKRTRNVHRTHRRLSRIAKPPLRLPHGSEPAMVLAHRRRSYTGRQNWRRICGGGKHGIGCA